MSRAVGGLLLVLALSPASPAVADDWSELVAEYERLRSTGEFESAIDVAERVLVAAERSDDAARIVESLCTLAGLRLTSERYDDARRLAQRAKELAEKELPANAPELGRALHLLGLAAHKQSDTALAIDHLQRSAEIVEHDREREASALGKVLQDLGFAQLDVGDMEGARFNFERAIQLIDHELERTEEDHFNELLVLNFRLSGALTGLLEVMQEQGDMAGRERILGRLVAVESFFGPMSSSVQRYLGLQAEAAIRLGHWERAGQLYARQAETIRSAGEEDSVELAQSLSSQAAIDFLLKSYGLAAEKWRESVAQRERIRPGSSEVLAIARRELAQLEEWAGNPDATSRVLRRDEKAIPGPPQEEPIDPRGDALVDVASLLMQMADDQPPGNAAETTLRMARLASGSGNDAAGSYYRTALQLRGGVDSPANLELLQEMAIYYEAQGKMELASSLRGIAEQVAGDRP